MNSCIYLSAKTRLLVVQRTENKNSQQIVFTMHSTANHNDMATFKKN